MSSQGRPVGSSYQVAVPGDFGPALLAAFAAMGVDHTSTSSVFLLPDPSGRGIPDIARMLQDRGFVILGIRRVTARPAAHRPALIPDGG
jgi:hypothetical protein